MANALTQHRNEDLPGMVDTREGNWPGSEVRGKWAV